MWQSTLLALAAALPVLCAHMGLRRLAPDTSISGYETPAAASAGALCGCAAAHLSQNGEVQSAAAVALFGFLAVSAVVDWRTAWAPTELALPVCIAAGFCAGPDGNGLAVLVLSSVAIGGGLFLSAWAFLALQARRGRIWFPPADAIALALPLILFETNLAKAALYFAVALALRGAGSLRVRRPEGSSGGIALPEGRVALLAVVYPALVAGLLAETLIVHSAVGAGGLGG